MPIKIEGAVSNVGAEVGGTTFRGLHVHVKPLEYGALGHYRTSVKIVMATAQNANSRLFEVRNTHASNFLIPTRLHLQAAPAGTVTTAYLGEWGCFKLTSFTAVDTTNTVTPTTSVRRTGTMAAYPGGAAVRHCTLAGAAAGMTGGTLTKDAQSFGSLLAPMATVAAGASMGEREVLEDIQGTHPFVFAQNEGWEVENVVAGSATANVVHVAIDNSWAEVTAF